MTKHINANVYEINYIISSVKRFETFEIVKKGITFLKIQKIYSKQKQKVLSIYSTNEYTSNDCLLNPTNIKKKSLSGRSKEYKLVLLSCIFTQNSRSASKPLVVWY